MGHSRAGENIQALIDQHQRTRNNGRTRQLFITAKAIAERSHTAKFYPFGKEDFSEGSFVRCASEGSASFIQKGLDTQIGAIPWTRICDAFTKATSNSNRGTFQIHYGFTSGCSYVTRTNDEIEKEFGCARPSVLTDTYDELSKDIFTRMSEIARTMGVDYANPEGMEAKMTLNPGRYGGMTFDEWSQRMNRFARSIDPSNVFEGMTLAFLRLDGGHSVKEHTDKHNCRHLSQTIVVSRVVMIGGYLYRVCVIGYMRKSVTDFLMRRSAAEEVGQHLVESWEALSPRQRARCPPVERFRGLADPAAICVAMDKDGQVTMAHLMASPSVDKEVTFLTPLVFAITDLSKRVNMTLREAVSLCLVTGIVSNMLVVPTVIRTMLEPLWPTRGKTPGGVFGLLMKAMGQTVGGLTKGPHHRYQPSFTARSISSQAVEDAVSFLVGFCAATQKGTYSGHDEKQTDELFSNYNKCVKLGLDAAGLKGCGGLLVQHLVKVLAMCTFLLPSAILRCAIPRPKEFDDRGCPKAGEYLRNTRTSGEKKDTKLARLVVLQEMNVVYARTMLDPLMTKAAVDSLRCEMYTGYGRSGKQRYDPFMPGQSFVELTKASGKDVLMEHTAHRTTTGDLVSSTTQFFGPSLAESTAPDSDVARQQNECHLATGVGTQACGSWQVATITRSDFPPNEEGWDDLRDLFVDEWVSEACFSKLVLVKGFRTAFQNAQQMATRKVTSRVKEYKKRPMLQGEAAGRKMGRSKKGRSKKARSGTCTAPNEGSVSGSDACSLLDSFSIATFDDHDALLEQDLLLMGHDKARIQWDSSSLETYAVCCPLELQLPSLPAKFRRYPQASNSNKVLLDSYESLSTSSEVLGHMSCATRECSNFIPLAKKALEMGAGYSGQLAKINFVTAAVDDKEEWFHSSLSLEGITGHNGIGAPGECRVCDGIGELLGGKRAASENGSLVWCFQSPSISIDYRCLCVVVAVGSADFFCSEAKLFKRGWVSKQPKDGVAMLDAGPHLFVSVVTSSWTENAKITGSSVAFIGKLEGTGPRKTVGDFCFAVLDRECSMADTDQKKRAIGPLTVAFPRSDRLLLFAPHA